MNYNKYFIIVHLLLFSFCCCEIGVDQKNKLINGFIDYYNNLPNQIYTCDEGYIEKAHQLDDTTYQIEAKLIVTGIRNIDIIKTLKCIATIQDLDTFTVTDNNCEEISLTESGTTIGPNLEDTEPVVERRPVQLQNEVQADTAITSGEQFIAIPRNQPKTVCVGCTTHVNPQAEGVSDLANLGVRHLDIHEPSLKHSLDSVIAVERLVQVVNGVRYILTLSVKFNNCSEVQSENCASSKTCKISILVKPWVKLPKGGNYKAIVGNNCTEEWLYGDDGEVLPEPSVDNESKGPASVGHDDNIVAKHNTNIESQPNNERTLTEDEIKNIQDQIIPNNEFHETTEPNIDMAGVSKQHVFKAQSYRHSENALPVTESVKIESQITNLNLEKKKAIDDMLDYFSFSGFTPKPRDDETVPRVRRSYDYDLQVLSLAEDYHTIKKSIENARFVYEMARALVEYLNEMDMEIKTRVVKNVIKAEEETENFKRFLYIQVLVTIPCEELVCVKKDGTSQICNGVIDGTNENSPQILNTFCYNDNKDREFRGVIKEVDLDDPVLKRLAEEAVKKIESDSKSQYALKINKIVSAITQITSGTLTTFSMILDNIKCNKSVSVPLRINCTVIEQLGSKVCEVIVHERHSLQERKISYTCTDRPTDMRMSKVKLTKNVTVTDPKVTEMLQEAIQYLETQSEKNNKQKLVSIKSISSQIVAGFLTKIEFVVGYTNCTEEVDSKDSFYTCELLKHERLRSCKAQIWDRSWIMDGRQVEVSCDDNEKMNEIEDTRKKRSIDTEYTTEKNESSNNSSNKYLEYSKLATEALERYMRSSFSSQHYKVVKVDMVTVKNSHSKLTKMDFSISPTNCLMQNDGLLSHSVCNIVNYKDLRSCRAKILENVWIEKTQYFVKCDIKNSEHQPASNDIKERDPKDSKYYQLAEESLKKYLNDNGNSFNHKIVRVEKVTTQIVSGLLTSIDFLISPENQVETEGNIVNCHSKILERRWLGTKEINVTCQLKKPDDSIKLNVNDPEYLQMAVEALQRYIEKKPDCNLIRVTFVDKVQLGDKVKIKFVASHKEDDDGDTLCYAEFAYPEHDIEVKCHLIGRILKITQIGEEDPKYYKYVQSAEDSLQNYLQSINSSQLYTIVSVENVTVHWDDGIMTQISFIISPMDLEKTELQGKRCLAQIREQPWLLKKDVNVKCTLEKELYRMKREVAHTRVRRQVLGGEIDQDPTLPYYKTLADESLWKYTKDKGITQPLEVVVVEKVTTQVVSGSLTRIHFVVSNRQDSNTMKCHSEIWERSWLKGEEKKIITVSCQDDHHRAKRQVPGGEVYQDPNLYSYWALAEESLQEYTKDMVGIKQPFGIERVETVTTQIIEGLLTNINFIVSLGQDSNAIKCHSEIWERPWLKGKEKKIITVSCKRNHKRFERQVPGGETNQDPNSHQYKTLAEESLQKYIIDKGVTQPLEVSLVEKVTTQVVSGTMTRIQFVASNRQDANIIKCHSEIWERPWLNGKDQKIITVSCQDEHQRAKRGLVGGETDQDPNSPQYKTLAEESLRKYAIDKGITQPLEVALVEKVTTQVVSGKMTRIHFVASNRQDSNTMKCHSEIWERPWLKGEDKKIITVSCQDEHQRAKRGLIGGETDQDPNSPQYKTLAEESLRKYAIDKGITQPLEVALVEKVTTQVVSGTMTRLHFVASNRQDANTMKCHSEIWERPWLKGEDKKIITVSCQDEHQRAKRGLVGGETDQDPKTPQYKTLAEESLRKYAIDKGITQPLEVALVEKVTTQVVSGTMTRLHFVASNRQDSNTMKCHSEIWERPWLKGEDKKIITVACKDDHQRAKRGLVGGETDQNPNSAQYKTLAEESLRKYAVDKGITQPLEVSLVEKVTTQVVSGTMTRIHFVASNRQDSNTIKCHSEIWERPWLKGEDKKIITVSCQDEHQRAKRELVGGETDQDPNSPQYKTLAEESLRKYAIDKGITQPLEVSLVEKVTKQVVSGTMTRIQFVASNRQDSNTIKCHSEIWERPWLKGEDKKIITVSCQDEHQRAKRGLVGGETDQDPNSPQYKTLAEESLRKYAIDKGITQPLEVALVEKVTTQVVSGSMTRIHFVASNRQDSNTMKCHSEIWERPWLKGEEKKIITVACKDDHQRAKRGLVGGETDQDPTSPQYKTLAEQSLRKYAVDKGITQPLEVSLVEKVTTQVVSGTMTRIHFVASNRQDSNTIKCHSEIWERPWLNGEEKKIITVSCQDEHHRAKRELVGGETDQDPNSPQYKTLAEESLRKYAIDKGITQPLEVALVEKVSTQVVSGTMTRIHFVASNRQDSNTIKCHSEIWERPWLKGEEKKIITVSCQDEHQRAKRGLVGGETDQDPNSPQYKTLAEESLRKYAIDKGITQPLEVALVEKVTTQVVSGTMTRIQFVASNRQDSNTIKCHSEIWERPWLKGEDKKIITVSCQDEHQRAKRELVGGETDQDPNSSQYKTLAEESLRKYAIDKGITQPLAVSLVEKVTTQVVSGTMTRIQFVASNRQDLNTIKCHSEIWERPWLNGKDKKIITVSCQDEHQRAKRGLVGGETDQDPNSPQYKTLAEESLRKYAIDKGITQPLEVALVEKVTTQVVSGTMTRIHFVASNRQDSNTIKCHSEIWERPWLNGKDKKIITVSCQDEHQRAKRELVGGETDQDPNSPQYKTLAEESMRKYAIDKGITQPLEVSLVEKVTTQVVSGTMTRIHFVASNRQDLNTIKCHSEIWERPWLKGEDKKIITVSCQDEHQRAKRELVGGETDQDPNSPQYKTLAEESLRKYAIDKGITQPLAVSLVEKVTTQVVSGTMTRIQFVASNRQDSNTIKCHSEIWERPWLNGKDKKIITVSCQDEHQRAKRGLVGGETDQDPNSPQYKTLAEESLRKYAIDKGITQPLAVSLVEKVTTQVVSGTMTRIQFVASNRQDSNTIKCHSEIWERPWLNGKDKKIITVSCQDEHQRAKRELVGGETDQDPNSPQYKTLAEESLRKYALDKGITQPLEVALVEKVSTQVVSGTMTRIHFVASNRQDSNTIKCHSEIWERPWLKGEEKKIITVSCQDEHHRAKRGLVGGETDQDPTSPQYKTLAEQSLRKYAIDKGITQPLEVSLVEKVTTQVVSGSMTRIHFVVSSRQDSYTMKCHSEIWERPWLNGEDKKIITITCQDEHQRAKRELVGGETDHISTIRQFKFPIDGVNRENSSAKGHSLIDLRGHIEEEQDPNKPEYKQLAEESLRKYERKKTNRHKVVKVEKVVTRVVSGIKYFIDFNAARTACSTNVSNVQARKCKEDKVTLYCHTEIWDRPWLKQKTINIQCYGNELDVTEDDIDSDVPFKSSVVKHDKNQTELAEEASEKYLTSSNRKYVHKVTEILSYNEEVAEGTIVNMEYLLSPTTCLRNETVESKDSCKLKQPLIVFHCSAKIWYRPWLQQEKDIKVNCKKITRQKGKMLKRGSNLRSTRQIGDEEDEIDEDSIYYYADRAIQHINDYSHSNNIQKLISIHAVQNSIQMGTLTVLMYLEVAETFCLRHQRTLDLRNCEEMNGLNHRLCYARLWPSPDDELIVRHVSVVCDDDDDFISITGVNIPELVKLSIQDLERSPENVYKLVHQGEPQVIPSLDSKYPFKINFVIGTTNCSKDVVLDKNPFQCMLKTEIPSKACHSFIWLKADTKFIRYVNAKCTPLSRGKRSSLDLPNENVDGNELKKLVDLALQKLEMSSLHRYKQRVLQINSHSTKITSGKVTTIDFDVGYTSCLKYEWVENIASCDFLDHLPRRRCVAQIWERIWIQNGQNIDVNCVDDETPLESHIEFESAEMANELARVALKHIEAKYPHPSKQKVVRIFSLEKQVVAGIHYKMKIEVGITDCVALSDQTDCKISKNSGINKFCRVNVWLRPWTEHPPNFRVSCDFQEGTTHDLYHHIQAEQLFYNFLTTYSPSYVNDYTQMQKRFEIFKSNIKKIHELNVHEKATAVYGVTRFADLTYEEFSSTYMGLKTSLRDENQVPMRKADIPSITVPPNFDWREYDAVTEVKDQGSCGSCWAFSVTGNIEGQWKMQSGQLVSLSEQELVDCDKMDNGCNGGLPDNAYRAIEQLGGLELEIDYPYEGEDDKCSFNKTLAKVQITGAVNITSNETGMVQWLVQNGPISIGINANAMQFYMGGISHPWKMLCNPTNLDHGVLIVGYGVKDYPLFHKKLPYWIIKNSWGKSWGEQGYYRVYRGDGTCGVNQMASSAVI